MEYGGAHIAHSNIYGKSVWDFVESWAVHDDGWTVLVKVMLLRSRPPVGTLGFFKLKFGQLIQDGRRLRARLPAYLVQRQALLNERCPLILPLQALVSGYAEPSVEELWATGLGVAP
jgi:hypothetical protein